MANTFPHSASELLRVATTVASVSVALAALLLREDSLSNRESWLAVGFMLAGLLALRSGLYAISEMWQEAEMSRGDLLGELFRTTPRPPNQTYDALIAATWALLLLVGADVMLLFTVFG